MQKMAVNHKKNHETARRLCETGDDLSKNKKFQLSLDFYTLGLLYSPALGENNSTSEEHPHGQLYYKRSLALFRLKRYESCVQDIKRAFANGKHSESRCIELLSRLAWCYWHLKEFSKCEEIVKGAKRNGFCKELDILASLLDKSKTIQKGGKADSKLLKNGTSEKSHLPSFSDGGLVKGENNQLKGVSSCASWNYCPNKGRFLSANTTIKPGGIVVEEEAYSGVLTMEFSISNCNYCFKGCKFQGIPCCGCSRALYCNEKCRWFAWQSYHWLECCMWPVLEKLDILAHLALRTLLCAAYEFSMQNSSDNTDWCSLIADYLHHTLNDTLTKSPGKRKNTKKSTKIRSESKMNGRNPNTNNYNHDYWSVFSLLAQEEKHTKSILTKCTLYANFISKVLNRLPAPQLRKQRKVSSSDHASVATDSTTTGVRNAFERLSLKAFCDEYSDKSASYHDMEVFREKTLGVSLTMAENAPMAKLKPQSCFYSKDIPRSFQEIVAFLLRRHMLQLQTNCQAIFEVVSDDPTDPNQVSLVSQQRIASAIFPSTSLLNHSCNANTVLSFTGRKIMVRTINTILQGSEITHCYGPCMSRHSFKDRQKILKEQYFFDCCCTACIKYKEGDFEEQVFMQQFTAYKCSFCDGPILILDSKSSTDTSLCGKCANEACKRVYDLAEAQSTYNKIVTASNTFTQRLFKKFSEDDLKSLEDCLAQFQKILYHNHHAIGSLHDQLAYHYSYKKDHKTSARHVTASLKITSMRFGSESVEAAQELHKLGTIYFNGQMRKEAEKFLNKSLAINRKISHLSKAEFVKTEAMLLALKTFASVKSRD